MCSVLHKCSWERHEYISLPLPRQWVKQQGRLDSVVLAWSHSWRMRTLNSKPRRRNYYTFFFQRGHSTSQMIKEKDMWRAIIIWKEIALKMHFIFFKRLWLQYKILIEINLLLHYCYFYFCFLKCYFLFFKYCLIFNFLKCYFLFFKCYFYFYFFKCHFLFFK